MQERPLLEKVKLLDLLVSRSGSARLVAGRVNRSSRVGDGSHSGSEELIQIINITINQDLQKELKCEVGVDIFMEMPWKIISRDNVLASIKRDGEQSPFYEYAVTLQNYPEEEVLVGRATLLECDSFLVAITIPGRTLLLEEIKASHLSTWNKVMTRLNHPIGVWKSLGTEEEMDTAGIKHTRPQISFDCYIKKDYHEKLFSEGFDQVNYYTELIEDGLLMIENIEGVVFDKYTQSCPLTQESYAQTVPEIPVNSATQFTTEMRVEEFKEKLEVLDLDYEVLNEKLTGFYNKVDTLLTYNEEYDLYRDDYEILATEGEDICMYPNIPYEHYATMITFIGTKDKVITGTSWHPSQTGLVAVAYGREHIVKVGDLNDNSDEEEVDKNILYEEDLFSSFPTSNQFDEFVENLWKKQIHKLEKDMKKGKHNTTDYDLAATSTEFLLQTKHIRLFEIIQDKKRLLRMPDAEDLYKEEKFEYPLFDIAKKRKKAQEQNQSIDSIIDKVMNEKPEFLKRDYLFSGNFHWKLNLADEIINPIDLIIMKGEGTIPKQYVRTFLFPEIWGETWFFGDDLKHEAIEVNKDFRESALMALGLPTVPNSKVFLPGYKVESSIDYTLEMNPWQWMDAWAHHCKYREENNIQSPDEKSDISESDDGYADEPFGFLFLRNMPLFDVKYERVSLQYFLCDNKDCGHCPYIINNVMKKEGINHICLKILMNKDNPNEVEKVIALPYEHVHGTFEKKEEKVLLQRKKKKNDDDEETFEDEFELPFCSSENGCIFRKILPDYLKDSKAKKMYCDQCGSVENSENKDLDGYDLFLEESEKILNESESINKDTNTSESGVSNVIWDKECIDNVGKFLGVSVNLTDQNLCIDEDKGSDPCTSGNEPEDESKTDNKCPLTSINPVDLKEKTNQLMGDKDEPRALHDKAAAVIAENPEDDESTLTPINMLFNNESTNKSNVRTSNEEKPDMVLEGDTIEIKHHFDKFSSSSSSETFRSALESIDDDDDESVNRKNSRDLSKIIPDKNANSERPKDKTNSKPDTIEFKDDSEDEDVRLDIKHFLDDPYDDSRDFDENTKKILDEKIEKLNSGLSSKIIHRPFEVLSSCVSSHGMIENSDDEEEVDKLNLVHHVAIWSLGNDIKPMQRLISPFELTCLSFCPHNGMYLIGGTTTGQVVLWNLEGVLDHDEFQMQERSDFDLIGFKHLERVMCWFKRVRRNQTPKNRLYITAISNRVTSHMDKVIDISWLPPNVKLSPTSGKYEEVDLKDGYSLQFMSTSVDGVIKCWDLNSPPLPFSEAHINKYSFQRPGQFKLPKPPKEHGSKLKELFMRWNPFFMIRLEQRDSLSVKRFYITYISHDQAIYSYERDRTMPDKGGINIGLAHYYKVESVAIEAMNHEAVAGTIDGNIILFTWKQSGQEGTYDEQEGIGSVPVRFFKQVHDGPINKIKRHPQNNQIFLSSGGQVFGLWKIDQEEPLKWRKYADKYVTAVGWTRLRPSSFMIGLSDGCMEIWDVYVNGNEPKMTLKVTTGAIYDFVVPILPIPMGLFGITDYKGILKFYVIPWEYQFPRENEEEFFFNKVEAEHQRRLLMNEKKKSQMSLIEEETSQHSVDEKLSEDLKEKESEEIIKKKELIGCRKFKDELYKWYLRRRGKNAAWLDEAEKKWFLKEQEYMIKTILQNKKIDLKELDDAIEPLYKKEKHAKDIAVKILDVLEMADEIFKKEVQQLVLARNYHNDTQVSLEIGKMNFGELEDAMEAIDLYFGESYEKTEEELNEFVEMNPITKEWTFAELCEKNQPIRDAWNDRRRLLKKEQKWSRELIGEELDKSGYKYSCYVNHEESYIKKKYKRRVENIEHLKKTYGDDYDPYWDLHDKSGSGRNKNKSEPTKVESGMQQKFNKYADVFNVHVESPSSKHPLHEVNVVIPEGSFYRKYMPVDKKIPWEKPIPYEERVYSHSKRFKDKLGESEMSVTSESSSSKDPAHLEGEEPDYLAEVPNVTNAVVKTAPQAHDSDSEQSESSSSSSTSKDNVEKESHKESVDKSRGSVRFSEHPKAASLVAKKEPGKKGKKEIDFEKEDVTGRYHGLEDLRRLVKEKKMRGEEFIDIDDLSSYSYESVLGPISSSGSSPDMSLKSEDLLSDEAEVDDNSENEYFQEQFKEFLEETPRYDPPKVVPYDGSEYEDEPTEEWMEDDLKIALKPHDQEEESEGDEEGPKKPDIKTTAILEKEKSIRDKVQELLTMEESSDVIQTAPPMDPSGSRIERIRHPFENKCMEDINFQE
ncbi:uncharacterized protein mmm isoform X2 [Halyomorpha halys]|uniref:uncharacterized protein mmm isoform X2 n=1 Tax=Halyomorpha halys TaxID=286706 RepID=UPI000D0C86E2|nr:uncharacterized protein LOC106682537 isoform X2 [Halyomorpha halys]